MYISTLARHPAVSGIKLADLGGVEIEATELNTDNRPCLQLIRTVKSIFLSPNFHDHGKKIWQTIQVMTV